MGIKEADKTSQITSHAIMVGQADRTSQSIADKLNKHRYDHAKDAISKARFIVPINFLHKLIEP